MDLEKERGGMVEMPPLDYPCTMYILLHCFVNAHLLAGLVEAFELHYARNPGKKRVIAALTYVIAGVELGSTLPYDYRSGIHTLSIETFYAEVLRIAVPSIP
jgi:hypothetical protein